MISGVMARGSTRKWFAWAYFLLATASLVVVINYLIGYALWQRENGTWQANPILKRLNEAHATLYPPDSTWVDSHMESLARARKYEWSIFGKLSKDWKSPSINIEHRNRRTWSPHLANPEAKTVFFFGGSAAWGWGQRDEFTIASMIAKDAYRDGVPLNVINYARIGWTAWEEVSFLSWLLATGAKPDYVIFYDGFNDLGASKEELIRDGYPLRMDEGEIRLLLEDPASFFTKSFSAWPHLLEKSYRGFEGDPSTRDWARVELTEQESKTVTISSDQCLRVLAARAELLARLAESYHVQPLVFFQPDIFTKHPVLPAERMKLLNERHASVLAAIRKRVRSALPKGTIDLGSVTDGDEKPPVFVDLVHMNEAGAEIIGRAIYNSLTPFLAGHSAAR
jgi:lysophospholipase L1-like esterase